MNNNNNDAGRETLAFTGVVLCPGQASGAIALVQEPLSFWGGYDSSKGVIVERAHPCFGQGLAGKILVMPRAKGSSSSSSVLAEAIRNGTGPAGVILRERDLIIAIGVIVARELYGIEVPLVVVDAKTFETLCASYRTISMDASDDGNAARISLA
jgi:predicted aconitase with swiveling domain